MSNEEKILELLSRMDERISSIESNMATKADVTAINERLDCLEDSQEETRSGVNRLLEWADKCGYVIKFPLPEI
ncbi:MAG: hypothetical protein LUG13_02505 [Oscillospiraceae bacterium]|nr:hypothetical protein [Oscillospiraceae bacterium]